MEPITDAPLKKTPLHSRHRTSGAKMVPFGGWEMPLEYSGIAAEHMAVRTRAALFDVSHMGEIEIAGADAIAAVQRISSNDAASLQVGQAQYSALLTRRGTFVDDLLVYRLAPTHFLLVVNAGQIETDFAWINEQIQGLGDVVAVNASSRYALLAVQGPAALEVLQPLTGIDLGAMPSYRFAHGEVANIRATVSRTGYTGEDGFEVFVPPQSADRVWQAILDTGRPVDVIPAGLGARDTLRLEAALRLSGQDIDATTTPLEAGLGWIVGWKKEDFNGAAALRAQKSQGVSRRLVGLELLARGIARTGHDVLVGGQRCGAVTSGTLTPFLNKAIGMAYLPVEHAADGTGVDIDIRGRLAPARVVAMPFYKRARA
ncbi:MAG: glycine cleavage system aminomethyltransferase GcvT [Acidobacteriota bacterium]